MDSAPQEALGHVDRQFGLSQLGMRDVLLVPGIYH